MTTWGEDEDKGSVVTSSGIPCPSSLPIKCFACIAGLYLHMLFIFCGLCLHAVVR